MEILEDVQFEDIAVELPFKELKAGYHYTSARNWRRIKKEGMIPYLINKPETEKYFPEGVRGIWCWNKNLTGKSETGSILYQVGTKQTTEIVKLKILYTEDEVLYYEGQRIHLFHHGHLEDWVYHTEESAIILTKPIEIERIELVREIDVIKKLTE